MWKWTAVAAVALVASACAPEEADPDPPVADPTAAHEDSVMLAEAMYDPEAFDTIVWDSAAAALERGAVVYSYSCAKCHGSTGAGDGGFVRAGETLEPPSFLVSDWRFADDRAALRKQVFTGTSHGMPHWGFYGLKYRDIDAVAAYIQHRLRSAEGAEESAEGAEESAEGAEESAGTG